MSDEVILSARNLSKEFSGFRAVSNVDLSVRKGSVHALIGPNGAGKTTVFNLLSRFLSPTAGTIHLNGRDIAALRPAEVAGLGLVRSFQISAIFPNLTVLQNIQVALQKPGWSTQFWRSDKQLRRLEKPAREFLDSVNLGEWCDRPASELSYGRKRALEIATTLALNPSVLLLDEPMAGMGQEDIRLISRLIRSLVPQRTIVMVEHNLSVVADICDVVTVLSRGEVLAEGTYSDVSRSPKVREAYLGAAE